MLVSLRHAAISHAVQGLATLAPRCALRSCPGRNTRWHGLWSRREGIRIGTEWFCSTVCLESALQGKLEPILNVAEPTHPRRNHRMPLGLTLLSLGVITPEQLAQALQMHRRGEGRVGACLRNLNAVTELQVLRALGTQWSCPVYPTDREPEALNRLPRALQVFHRMAPMHWVQSTRELYVAFSDSIDYGALLGIERMLDCRTRPCIGSESAIAQALETCHCESFDRELLFSTRTPINEAVRIICGYAQQIGAEDISFSECSAHVWVRLRCGQESFDLLFRRWFT